MNEYLFYTDEGFTIAPNENEEVENCQVLGRAKGNNEMEACEKLAKEYPWIKKCGFSMDDAMSVKIASEGNEHDSEIIEYLIHLLDKRQLEQYITWLQDKGY